MAYLLLAPALFALGPMSPPKGESGGFVKAIYRGALYTSEGRIDVERTIEALRRANANAIVLDLGYEKQWEDVLNFLPEATR